MCLILRFHSAEVNYLKTAHGGFLSLLFASLFKAVAAAAVAIPAAAQKVKRIKP